MKRNKGFTLIELMIVLAIVGILVAVAIPFVSKVVQKAKAKSDGKEVVYVVTLYSNDGKVLETYNAKDYSPSTETTRIYLTLKDGTKVVVNGTYKIEEKIR